MVESTLIPFKQSNTSIDFIHFVANIFDAFECIENAVSTSILFSEISGAKKKIEIRVAKYFPIFHTIYSLSNRVHMTSYAVEIMVRNAKNESSELKMRERKYDLKLEGDAL